MYRNRNKIYNNAHYINIFLFRRIAQRVYEDIPLSLPNNDLMFYAGGTPRLKLRDSSRFELRNKTNFKRIEDGGEHGINANNPLPSSNFITVDLNRQRYESCND